MSTELVAIKTAGALYLIQSLNELFADAFPRMIRNDPTSFLNEQHLDACDEGRTASGFDLIRNSEPHDATATIDDEARRLITAFSGVRGAEV